MDTNPDKFLEELIHKELAQLPERTAPESLIAGVLQQIQARAQKRWWQCGWIHWPAKIRFVSLALLLASVAGGLFGVAQAWDYVSSEFTPVSTAIDSLAAVWDVLDALGGAVILLARSTKPEWLLLALCVPLGMYFAFVGLATLCYRVAVHSDASR